MRAISSVVLSSVVFCFGFAASAKAADAAHGEQIARRWCAPCHVVSADQKQASADVATFAAVARSKTDAQIANFLADPHPKMPDLKLSRDEIGDLVAYIRSLAPVQN
jgi:mono/diheme cytochrome c family protein